jgi:hypothetical protein
MSASGDGQTSGNGDGGNGAHGEADAVSPGLERIAKLLAGGFRAQAQRADALELRVTRLEALIAIGDEERKGGDRRGDQP